MCGRFVGYRRIDELRALFGVDRVAEGVEDSPNYNVAPTQKVFAVIRPKDETVLGTLVWGLVPFWAKDPSIGNRMINARVETVDSKPAFRAAFRKRRCLIPADGFYEWTGEAGKKQPMYITLPDGQPFGFAGLWESWDNKGQEDQPLFTCTILTTDASESIKDIHHRMPVILKPEAHQGWLTPAAPAEDLKQILSDEIETEFAFRQVSKAVNSVKNNSPDLITAI